MIGKEKTFGVLLAMVMIVTACGEKTTYNYPASGAKTSYDVVGEVNDAASLQAIEGATIELSSETGQTTICTRKSAASGTFLLPGIPVGTYTARVTAAGFAGTSFSVNVSAAIGTAASMDVGHVLLGKPMDLTVMATSNGVPTAGVPVMAFMTSPLTGVCNDYYLPMTIANSGTTFVVSATTGTSGTVVLDGLSQCGGYEIMTGSFDSDGDGLNDYAANAAYYTFDPETSVTSMAIAITAVSSYGYTEPQQVVASNMRRSSSINYYVENITDITNYYSSYFSGYDTIGASQPIRLVFSYPLSLSGTITASYTEDLADPDGNGDGVVDTAFPVEMPVAITTSFDPTGMVLMIAPPVGGFPINRLVKIHGAVNVIEHGTPQVVDLGDISGWIDRVYISDDTVTGLNSATTITADNYNGNNGSSSSVYLEFPEYVTGAIRVLSCTKSGVPTIVNGTVVSTRYGEMVFTDGNTGGQCAGRCGSGAGVFYRVDTGLPLSDGDDITVEVDVTDIEGYRFTKQVQLTVQ